jgi:ABC-type polysaccharide/polyol phosphate transport system ATPase subunit
MSLIQAVGEFPEDALGAGLDLETHPGDEPEVLMEVEGLSKRFCRDLKKSLLYGVADIAREAVGREPRKDWLRRSEFWALRDISFKIRRGESVGLVGKNGSGKTTLMRILSGLIKPTVGRVMTKGRVAPLLALGAGFNPILTGRENIYINMAVLGLTRPEIDERFDDVVKFSEIEYALDAPVQNYSSGMTARLGFSCAIHTRPDILLIDEVLAVGDLQFRQKCMRTLNEMRATGTTFIIVNHAATLLLQVCNKAVYIESGKLLATGDAEEVIEQYETDLFKGGAELQKSRKTSKPVMSEEFELDAVEFEQDGRVSRDLRTGKPAALRIDCKANVKCPRVHFTVKWYRLPSEEFMTGMEETLVAQFSSNVEKAEFWMERGTHTVRLPLEPLVLAPGSYQVAVDAFDIDDKLIASRRSPAVTSLAEIPCRHSAFYQPHRWEIVGEAGRYGRH